MLLGHFAGSASLEARVRRALFSASQPGWMHHIHPDHVKANVDGTGAVSVGDPVAFIEDISGNGNHATQLTPTARALLQQDAGGKYYLQPDAADDYYRFTDVPVSADGGRIIAVSGRDTTVSQSAVIVGNTDGPGGYLAQIDGYWYYRSSATPVVSSVEAAIPASVIASIRDGVPYLRVDDSEFTNAVPPYSINPFGVLFRYDGDGGSSYSAFTYYGGVLGILEPSTDDIALVKRWLDQLRAA